MDRIKLVFSCDNNYFLGLAGTLTSLLLFSSTHEIDIHIIDGGISDENHKKLTRIVNLVSPKVKLIIIKPDLSLFDHLPAFSNNSMMTYARLLIPELIKASKVIYVDTDILFTKDIKELWQLPLNGKTVAAGLDFGNENIGMDCSICDDLRISSKEPYFNAGLLVIDLNAERENNIMQKTMQYINTYPEQCRFHDQSGLNVILHKDVLFLDQSWNTQSRNDTFEYANEPSKIIGGYNYHFVLGRKPWMFYDEGAAHMVFVYLLKKLGFNYKNDFYEKSKRDFYIKKTLFPFFPFYYKTRGKLLFFIKGRSPQSDYITADYWEKVKIERHVQQINNKIDIHKLYALIDNIIKKIK